MKTKVLFVCLGNICRSPTAEAVFRGMASAAGMLDKLEIDSAGTSSYHIGEAPDSRATAAAKTRGYEMSHLVGRQVKPNDFERYDYILAMDNANLRDLRRNCPAAYQSKVELFLHYANRFDENEVPDPYYGGAQGFEHVLDLVEDASKGLLDAINANTN